MKIQLTERQKHELIQEAQDAFWLVIMNHIDPKDEHDLGGWASISQAHNDEVITQVAAEAIEDFIKVVND